VRVFNYAQISPETWKSAQALATRIFDQTGIATFWLDCSLSPEGRFMFPECDLPPRPTDIVLRLVPTSPATRTHFGDETLGIAAPSQNGTPSSASVFYDRVEELAKGGAASVSVILGQATAHEIGHLLLGSNAHAPLGLMRGRWSRSDLRLANDAKLVFSRREALAIREEVRRWTNPPADTSSGPSAVANPSDFRKSEATLLEASVLVYNYADVSPEVLAMAEKRADAIFQEMNGSWNEWIAPSAAFGQQPERSLKITLRVYNYAEASSATLAGAERTASRILHSAGIETVWLDCLSSSAEEHMERPCQKPVTPTDLVLRILAERGSTRREFRDSHLGFALPSDKGGFHVSIFYPDVESLAEKEGVPQDQLLGHGVAHEIGHLLLNSSSHFPFGLMRGKWDSKDLQRAARGDLLFTAEQARSMRSEMVRRMNRHKGLPLSTLQ
jgi:hypothetical protein